MTLTRFNLLPDDEKANLLYNMGVFLDERSEAEYRILLYRLHGFYVEVFYEQFSQPMKFVSFFSIKLLEPYVSSRFEPSTFSFTGGAYA